MIEDIDEGDIFGVFNRSQFRAVFEDVNAATISLGKLHPCHTASHSSITFHR
jgi:hypothetical protein